MHRGKARGGSLPPMTKKTLVEECVLSQVRL